jgi:hypothetical protein
MGAGDRNRPLATRVLLFLFALAIQFRFLRSNPFFFADDFGLLADADNLTRGTTGFFDVPAWGVWRLGERGLWLVEYQVFGLNPLPYAIVSILLHALVVVLVAILAERLGWGRWRSLAAAALFASLSAPSIAIHYFVQNTSIVGAVAVIASLLAHDRERPALATGLVLIGALFYEQALCAPLAMIAINVWRKRRASSMIAAPVIAVVLFILVNLWTLRHATKIFAYNTPGGTDALRQIFFAPWLALGVPPVATTRLGMALLLGAVTLAIVGAAIGWSPARGVLLGLGLAWIAALPYVGRNVIWWPDYYFYLSGVGAALAFAAPRLRGWPLLCIPLIAWNLRNESMRTRFILGDMHHYEQVTRETPIGRPDYAVFVNVNSGLAWAGWQFGGSLKAFELWDVPGGPARCYTGSNLEDVRAQMLADFPKATRRGRWPEDRPSSLRKARPPARVRLFPWPVRS